MRLYRFIDSQKTSFPVKILCRVCETSTSAFYDWAGATCAGPDAATIEESYLANRIYDIWSGSRRRYGVPRVTAQLSREGRAADDKKVARLMRMLGIQGICGRRKVVTTRKDPAATPAPDLVQRDFHSDHGCQYTSAEYAELCTRLGITRSMGTVGDSNDNAMAESVWASLKRELVYETHFKTIAEARVFVFEWILWYNQTRLHSSLGYVPPVEFEERLKTRTAA
ncbi:MAG TPA: integrase core domain-containing protein [Actinomycetota bacterium]|nr:integrase core domain-containing protein [Actinomycetota bacterium]